MVAVRPGETTKDLLEVCAKQAQWEMVQRWLSDNAFSNGLWPMATACQADMSMHFQLSQSHLLQQCGKMRVHLSF